MKIELNSIGVIHTPYLPTLPIPHQPLRDAPGEFWISLHPEYVEGLHKLATYRYITVLYYLDQSALNPPLKLLPPWAPEIEVGVFASRSPNRPNPIGLSIVELKGIEGNDILISGIDVYNRTPLLDIKPYIKCLDAKNEANDGWYDELEDKEHTLAHLLELPHSHNHSHHSHNHSHHAHSHTPLQKKSSLQRTFKAHVQKDK